MAKLVDTTVSRSGATSRYLTQTQNAVTATVRKGALRLFFGISSKGGGTTELYVDIGPSDFAHLISGMTEVDRQTAMSAMAAELARQVADQPTHDRIVAGRAREALKSAAETRYENATSEAEDLERLIFQRISKLTKDIAEQEETSAKVAA